MPRTTSNRIAGWMIAVVLLVVAAFVAGAVMFGTAVDRYRDGKETEDWVATTGHVTSSSMDSETRTVRRKNRRTKETTYTPVVRYEYSVDGVTYEGDNIRADDHGGSYSRASEIIGRYPKDSETTVYYDPDHPERAVLVRGAESAQIYLFGGFGIFFVLVGIGLIGLMVFSIRLQKRLALGQPPDTTATGPVAGQLSHSH